MNSVAALEGKVVSEELFRSDILQTNRMVRIYVPPSYSENRQAHYPVLYVHDGQNAFSTVGPYVAFGWGNWELDKTADRLIEEKRMREIIIVAIDCSASRYREYRGPIPKGSDNRAYERYSRFLIEELKPKIDAEYRTLADPAHTGVLGSSMGGICSVALGWEHPDVFGNAASLSGAFQVEKEYFLKQVLQKRRPEGKALKVYVDSGSSDYTGGDDGKAQSAAVAEALRRNGVKVEHFVDGTITEEKLRSLNLSPQKLKEAQGSHHNELYWRERAWRPLVFLFPAGED